MIFCIHLLTVTVVIRGVNETVNEIIRGVNETVNEIIFFRLLNEIVNETIFYFVVSNAMANEMIFFTSLSESQCKIHENLCFISFYGKRNGFLFHYVNKTVNEIFFLSFR
jgi:hypothetical protein